MILDEPFSGFDPINTTIIRNEILRLRDEGATVILSTHNMGSVEEICDRIALINSSKKILEGGVKEVRETKAANSYKITYKGNKIAFTNALWTQFELVSQSQEDGNEVAEVNLLQGATFNQLLKSVLDTVELINVEKIIPSMNDIFIQTINEQKSSEA
ncbi:MAG: DUF4162 domain-containing protein [Flavobacteriales bacterium]|nr:DUF4162 domain-containing protein [Flavobacteriales bacterium]